MEDIRKSKPIIRAKRVSFTYEESSDSGIFDLNLEITKGECILLCGKSGCGKTTLIKMINGLIPYFISGEKNGKIYLGEQDIDKTPMYEIAGKVASVFQNPKSQFFNVEPESEITFSMENQGLPLAEVEARLAAVVAELGIGHLMKKTVFGLSGGEKQIIAFASAYAAVPDIAVLDEPSANLDAGATAAIAAIMKKMKAAGTTILIAEHRVAYLRDLVDRAVLIEDGKIAEIMSSRVFYSQSDGWRKEHGLRQLRETWDFVPRAGGLRQDINPHLLEVRGLGLAYGRDVIAADINLSIRSGDIMALIGENGAGKTTLCRCLCGLHKEQRGQILFDGKPVPYKMRRKLSYLVMQDVNHQLFGESVKNECLLGNDGIDPAQVDDVLKDFELYHRKDAHPQTLSGGQKQRLAVSTAVLSGKQILIFDEPTSGLDYENMQKVCKMMKELAARGHIILMVTHDTELIENVCTRCLQVKSDGVTEVRSDLRGVLTGIHSMA